MNEPSATHNQASPAADSGAAAAPVGERSCAGCKFLYAQDEGYSNWTVMDTTVNCAKERNPNLPADEPFDWRQDADNWPKTITSRCELYAPGPYVTLDVDHEDGPADQSEDAEQIAAICAHSGREAHGTP